ncbi:hypothetical protein PPO43_13020 [Saprospira sp. CCB-QB6]|uniref:hypothetical protein n=1 Tax=Saprospira sp. CCB-QB6 TaxID=3023936 RepID=UPI00234A311D|nr:hypothetical protein [Saprospira sp. CCB-QB6]WCL80890.1 hypothetical protein PPO43_13020 [Saprospira sp. CCB-QB6]
MKKTIKIVYDKIFINNTDFIPLSQTNLPIGSMEFKKQESFFLDIHVQFNKEENILNAEITNYSSNNKKKFLLQQLKDPSIKIEFFKINWSYFEHFLSIYKKSDLLYLLDKKTINQVSNLAPRIEEEALSPIKKAPPIHNDRHHLEKTIRTNHKVNFSKKLSVRKCFKDIKFIEKAISFSYMLPPPFLYPLDIEVKNNHILANYEHIKNYIAQQIGKDYIEVEITIIMNDGKIEYTATSKEIDLITSDIIDSIKQFRINYILKLKDINSPTLFSLAEIFSLVDKNINNKPNSLLKQNELEVMSSILNGNIRNKLQIEYLQSIHSQKLKFTLQPNFGFLFFVEGKHKNFYCWELLNTHATYLWSQKNSSSTFLFMREVEKTINYIQINGRKKYRKQQKLDQVNLNLEFYVIYHKKANGNLNESFLNWREKICNLIN